MIGVAACYSGAGSRTTAGRVGIVAILLAIGAARAASASVEDAAETMFQRGLADMLAGRYGSGCPAIAESLRLERRPGTLFTLAECEARAGLTASALEHYDAFLRLVAELPPDAAERQQERRRIASEQRASLFPQVPVLTIRLPREAPSDIVVKRDEMVVDRQALETPLHVDPGPHLVTAGRPGAAFAAERRFSLRPGERKDLAFATDELVATDGAVRRLRWKQWGPRAAVAGLVLAAAGGTALWIARRKVAAINAARAAQQPYNEGTGDYPVYQAAGAGLLVTGAAALIAGGTLYLLGSRPLLASRGGAAPLVVAVTLSGSF